MLRKILFTVPLFIILYSLFLSPAHAQAPTNPPINSCETNGNYCIPNGEACETGHIRGSGGLCQSNWVCCQIPVPTQPPPGGPPNPIPLPTYPTNFSLLEYPCDQTTNEEFHPLRPYPGSPCDPLIPRKQEPEYLSFACGKSLNTLGEYEVQRQYTQTEIDNMDTTFQNYGEPYRCGAQICIRKRTVFDITLDLSAAKLPIVGNTQDPIDEATKANTYLSWYLAGTNPTWLDDLEVGNPSQNVNSQCIGSALSTYMNTIISGTSDLRNVRLTSPAFNLTNPAEQDIFIAMRSSGANFTDIDAFAGNTYTLNGVDAFDWVTSPTYRGVDGKTWKERFNDFGKSIIFTEFGDFATFDHPIGSPTRASVIDTMRDEYNDTSGDPVVRSLTYFNAFGGNPEFIGHQLTNSELQTITNTNPSKAGVNSAQGVNREFPPRVADVGLRWSVEIVTSPGDTNGVIESVNAAHLANVTPIIRACYGDSCGFSDPALYVSFIREVSQRVTNQSREIWFIAGPNEPAGEHWAAPQCSAAGLPIASVDSFLTYSGPIKKLLPQSTLDTIRFVLNSNQSRNVHNYLLDSEDRRLSQVPSSIRQYSPEDLWTKLFQRVPLATMEDTVGEVTIGLITSQRAGCNPQDPATCSPQPLDVYVDDPNSPDAMRLTIRNGSDSRLYFPHLKTVSSLIEVLNSISRPKLAQNYQPDDRNVTQIIDRHQGFGDGTAVQLESNEGNYTGFTRNTEIRENEEAPVALFGQTNHLEFDQRCELTTLQTAEGDNLFGKSINGRLAYSHDLKFDPVIIPPNCGGGDLANCTSDSNPAQGDFGKCCPQLATRCEDIDDTPGYDWRCTGGSANRATIPTEARVAVFTKTPLIDRFYSDLISDTQAFFRRFINWYDTSGGGPDTTIRSGSLTFPAKTQVGSTASNVPDASLGPNETNAGNPHAGAGNNSGGPEIYFPRLGSLADYFLGGPTNERLNLQKMLRPKYFGSVIGPGGTGILAACQPYLSNFPGSISVNIQSPKEVFSKVGDSITASSNFLVPFSGSYTLGRHTDLQPVVNFFTPRSFERYSYSSCSAKRVDWPLSTPPRCDRDGNGSDDLAAPCGTNSPFQCELSTVPSAVSLIMLGTNDFGRSKEAYKQHLGQVVDYAASHGSIPILSTLPHLLTGTAQDAGIQELSDAVKEVSAEKGVPLMDYRLATEQMIGQARNYGIGPDNIHPSVGGTGAGDLSDLALSEGGYNVRNFVALCALDAIWKTRLGGGGSNTCTPGVPANLPAADASCNSFNGCTPYSFRSPSMQRIFESAAGFYKVPVSVLLGVFYNEGGLNSPGWDENRVLNASGPMCIDATSCGNVSSTGAAGPWQWIETRWPEFANAAIEAGARPAGYIPNRCNLLDATFAAAKKLHNESGGAASYPFCSRYTPPGLLTNAGPVSSCSAWTESRILTAARQYLGYCDMPTGMDPNYSPSFYCRESNFNNTTLNSCYQKSIANVGMCRVRVAP